MFEKILIANRGEIALRIQRACREMGIKTVAVHSEADADAKYVMLADESVCIGPRPRATATSTSRDHQRRRGHRRAGDPPRLRLPLGERRLRRARRELRLRLHRPARPIDPHDGRQDRAKAAMKKVGHPVRAGLRGPAARGPEGDPPARRGDRLPGDHQGRGRRRRRGMRVVHTEAALVNAVTMTRTEAQNAFNNPTVYLEKFLENPRHIEIQVLADEHKQAIYLGERDCSMQRRHQKIIEEGRRRW
jgi:acetyl-CoA carboxylase biotin carboxylase subunit